MWTTTGITTMRIQDILRCRHTTRHLRRSNHHTHLTRHAMHLDTVLHMDQRTPALYFVQAFIQGTATTQPQRIVQLMLLRMAQVTCLRIMRANSAALTTWTKQLDCEA